MIRRLKLILWAFAWLAVAGLCFGDFTASITRSINGPLTQPITGTGDQNTPILELDNHSYWLAGTNTVDSQQLPNQGTSSAGSAEFGSTSGSDSNDPTDLRWYAEDDYDVTVDGVNYKYLSENLESDGSFDAVGGWDIQETNPASDITISGGKADLVSTDGTWFKLRKTTGITVGKTYLLQVDVDAVSGTIVLSDNHNTSFDTITSTGAQQQFVWTATQDGYGFQRSGTCSVTIDNVIVREVTANLGDYVYLPGTSGNYPSHPDSAAVSVTGDITIQVECALDDWGSGSTQTLIGKVATSNNEYLVRLNGSGVPEIYWSVVGSSFNGPAGNGSVAVPFADREKGFLRLTVDVDNGSSDSVFTWYTSTDGENFTQLGSASNGGAPFNFYDGNGVIALGYRTTTDVELATGNFSSAHIWDSDIGDTATSSAGTPVMHWEASSMSQSGGADEESGEDWTLNRSSSGVKLALVTRPTILFDSSAPTYLVVADHDDLDVESGEDTTFWALGRYHDAGATNARVIDKRSSTGSGYVLYSNLKIYHDPVTDAPTDGTLQAVTFSEASLMVGVRSGTELILNVNGSTQTDTVTTDSLETTADLGLAANPATGTDANDLELWAFGVLKGTALSEDQLATLKTELDALLEGRTGE